MSDSKGETKSPGTQRGAAWSTLFSRPGPFARTAEGFEPSATKNAEKLRKTRVLVCGAGRRGCEVIKQLAMAGFVDVHVIDCGAPSSYACCRSMTHYPRADRVETGDLKNSLFFRKSDFGLAKAAVAAAFIERRCKGVKVTVRALIAA
jgi:ubiquitin-activating enzyme E1 C